MKIARYGALICALTLALSLAAPALAAGPPSGAYECTLSGSQYFGKVKVKGSTYTPSGQKKGKWKASGGKITFKSGPWKKLFSKGRYYKTTDGGTEIALTTKASNFEATYCSK